MKTLKDLYYIIFAASVCVIVFYIILHIADRVFVQKNSGYIIAGVGSFMGAFFAFLFFIISEQLKTIKERRKKHINALVGMEYMLNKNLTYINDNLMNVGKLKECIEKNILFYTENYFPLKFNENLLASLLNIDFINDVFSYGVIVDKINEDLKMIKQHYINMNQLYLEGKISTDSLHKQFVESNFMDNLKIMMKELEKLDKKTEELIVKSQILFNKDKLFFSKIVHCYVRNRYPSKLNKLYQKKIVEFRKERNKIRNKSKKEIDGMMKGI